MVSNERPSDGELLGRGGGWKLRVFFIFVIVFRVIELEITLDSIRVSAQDHSNFEREAR